MRLAFSNIISKKLRMVLTIGGIGLSTGIMVVLFGLGSGLQSIVNDDILESDFQNVVAFSSKNSRVIRLNQDSVSKIKSLVGVSDVEQIVGLSGSLSDFNDTLNLPIYGITEDYFGVSPVVVASGETRGQVVAGSNNMIVTTGALAALGINTDEALGKELTIRATLTSDLDRDQEETTRELAEETYVVQAVIDKGSIPSAYIPIEVLYENGLDAASQGKAQLSNPDKMESVRESIEQLGFETSSARDTIEQVNQIFSVIQNILVVFGFITLAVAVLSTFNTIAIELVEQTKQIGFLRILGIKKRDVGVLFVVESIMLTSMGTIVGIVFGVLVGSIMNGVVNASLEGPSAITISEVYQLPLQPIIIMLVLALALGWAVGLIPSKRAVKINPLDAMKT